MGFIHALNGPCFLSKGILYFLVSGYVCYVYGWVQVAVA